MLKTRSMMLAATSLAAGILTVPGWAQDLSSPDAVETIVVTGIRGSMQNSAAIKRDTKQIVDVITAEDVGKLPDNNVPEALAHVTGVQIERARGEGSSVSIRGMTDVATTLNGNSASIGESRSMNLSDIPAELLKSVTVYKTRSADQVEGGIAGAVNVDLRRPLDLPDGLTVAGSFREVNASIGDTWSPYASLLVSDRFQTGIGEFGALLNVSFTQNNYFENYFYNESPDTAGWSWAKPSETQTMAQVQNGNKMWNSLPSSQQALNNGYGPVVPYAVYYGFEQGSTQRPSVNLSTQWRLNDNLDFVLEGSYISSKNKNNYDKLRLQSRTDGFTFSNVQLQSGTGSLAVAKSYDYSNGTTVIPAGPDSMLAVTNSDEFNTNLETHWHSGRWQANASAQYNWSGFKEKDYQTIMRFNSATSGSVEFTSPKADGGPFLTFGNVDLNDESAYDISQYHDLKLRAKTQEFDGQLDLTYTVSNDWYLRNVQFGGRFTNRHTERNYGYRDAYFYDTSTSRSRYMPVSQVTCGDNLKKIGPDLNGAPSWYIISPTCILNNQEKLHSFIASAVTANVATTSAGSKPSDWTALEPPDTDTTQEYNAHEYSGAGYVQANWALNAYFPVDGQVGVRVVNTWGDARSSQYNWSSTGLTVTPSGGTKNYTDVMPSGNAVIHFADKFQMRLSYYYQISRPDFMTSTNWQTIDTSCKCIWAGNPDLKPMREHNYDATMEYFFGRGGLLSLGYFLKKPHGWLYYDEVDGNNPYKSGPYSTYRFWTTYNANPGTFEGVEFTAQSFFDFLPGFWSDFGGKVNATLNTSYKIQYPYSNYTNDEMTTVDKLYAAQGVSRYTYNLELYYDTPMLSGRVAYNFRAKWRSNIYSTIPAMSTWNDPTSRLDAAINYTPYKWVTFSLEGANLLEETNHSYWGNSKYLPESTRMAARTIQLSARFRY